MHCQDRTDISSFMQERPSLPLTVPTRVPSEFQDTMERQRRENILAWLLIDSDAWQTQMAYREKGIEKSG